jgi:hypothetical protein
MTDVPDNAQELVGIWIAGYFSGYEEGIKHVASILKNAKEHDCPISDECADIFVALGTQLEQRANKMTHKEAAAIREDNEDG